MLVSALGICARDTRYKDSSAQYNRQNVIFWGKQLATSTHSTKFGIKSHQNYKKKFVFFLVHFSMSSNWKVSTHTHTHMHTKTFTSRHSQNLKKKKINFITKFEMNEMLLWNTSIGNQKPKKKNSSKYRCDHIATG